MSPKVEPGRTAEGYRKHPYHKSQWGSYPSININKGDPNHGQSIHNKLQDLGKNYRPELEASREEVGTIKRSTGNFSIRSILARLNAKTKPRHMYYRCIKIHIPWIIQQIARFSLFWEGFIYLTIITNLILISFSAFYAFYEEEVTYCITATDTIFVFDMFLRLIVEIWRYRRRATVVVFTAPYTMLQFLLDLISVAPLSLIFFWIKGSATLTDISSIDYFRFNRFVRFSRCLEFFTTLERQRIGNARLLFLFKFSNYYLGFIYITGCIFVYVIGLDAIDYLLYKNMSSLKTSYLGGYHETKEGYGSTPWDMFVITTTFSTAVVTTVGYGDVKPFNEVEMSICIVCMLVGAVFLNGMYTSEMTNLEAGIDGARFDMFYRLREIRNYLSTIATLPFFDSKVEDYYRCLWTYREGVFDVPFMNQLPETFQEELMFDICQEMFDKSQLFYKLDPAFLRAVSKSSTITLYNPNMILCFEGKHANKMYYILQGECQAMSKLNPANPSAVIRAGSIIGEINLFFSFPYTTTVETKTCCQFIIITKRRLFDIVSKFRYELETLRTRCLQKLHELYETHQTYGLDPLCWVKGKTDLDDPGNPPEEKIRRNMRWGTGLNREILEDVVDDSQENVIFDTPCSDSSLLKNHLIPYQLCVVPEFLNSATDWVTIWNYIIMALALWFAFAGPYCLVFPESTKVDFYMCRTQNFFTKITAGVFIVDVFVEIVGACPVSGWYYKFWDGLTVVRWQPTFYLDLLAALPIDVMLEEDQSIWQILGITFKVFKMWKVIRYLHYLDNIHPLELFWFRLMQTILVTLYGIHFIACICYNLACPFDPITESVVCLKRSWLASYEILYNTRFTVNTLGYNSPYLISFYYSATTLTSAGFGDFNPQNRNEMLWAIGFQLFGFFLIGYYTSLLTSALSCLVRPGLALQQHLVSLKRFMQYHRIREQLRERIIEYFVLQHQLRGGVSLLPGQHLMYDAPGYLRDDALYLEVFELLDGVPVFSKLDSDIIIKLSQAMKKFLIPPNTTFIQMGEVRRTLYVIKLGSMGIFSKKGLDPKYILEASAHFGIRDLLFGEPCHYTIRSLSYVTMYSVKLHDVQDILADEDELWELVRREKERIKNVIHEMAFLYSSIQHEHVIGSELDIPTVIPSWIEVPRRTLVSKYKKVLSDKDARRIAKVKLLNDEFEEAYKSVRCIRFFKLFLLRKTVHPVGTFSKLWNCLMSFICSLTVVALMLETFCYIRMPWFRGIQFCLDVFNYMDIYLKLHWSYYNPNNGILITHPLKTATNYILHGSLVMDVAICAPMELSMWICGQTNVLGYGRGATWYSKLRWIRFFQFKRIPVVFNVVHNIFDETRGILLLTLYITATLFLSTAVSTIAVFIACPWEVNDWEEGDQFRIPICSKATWVEEKYCKFSIVCGFLSDLRRVAVAGIILKHRVANADEVPEVLSNVFRRWVLGQYYVIQVVLVIGFGDMITLEVADVIILVFMCVFGFLFMRCVIADLTAAEVDSDEARAVFVEHMKVLDLVMKREKVNKKLSTTVLTHLLHTWNRSKGLQPRELFGELHPALESELYRNIMGDRLKKVPIFSTFPASVLRSLCRYMKTQYFLPGERIVRFGNLGNEMCVIILGRVYVADQHLNYICSLGAGKSFGEASLVYGTRRNRNIVAACNTKIYTLSALHFETFLGRYPKFRNAMKSNLASNKRDYYEKEIDKKIIKAENLSDEQKEAMLNVFDTRSRKVREMVSRREDFEQSGLVEEEVAKRNRFIGCGEFDDNLPFLYFAVPPKKRRCCNYPVLHPNCPFMKFFSTVVTWMCVLTPAIAAYEVCFSKDFLNSEKVQAGAFVVSQRVHDISEGIEITLLIDICLQFFLAYEVKDGIYSKDHGLIIYRYVTAIDGFFYHLLGSAPYLMERICGLFGTDLESLAADDVLDTILENIYLLRCIRLYRYYQSQMSKKNDLGVSIFRLRITLSVTSFCLMAHMLACIFYWISPCKRPDLANGTTQEYDNLCPPPTNEDGNLDQNAWTTEFAINKNIQLDKPLLEAWRWWYRALYWVVTTISTTGFGDIVPVTINEMIVGICCIFCGAFILSIILSQFTSGMSSLTKTHREYMYQVSLLLKHLKNIGLSERRQSHVVMYFLNLWERCRGTPYHKSWHILPTALQIEVAYALFGDTLSKVPYFRDNQEGIFLRQLCYHAKHSLSIPGAYIHNDGDPGSTLFVVYKGVVSGIRQLPNGDPDLKAIYNPGDAFGRFAACFHDGNYKKSYRAETFVEILEIKQKELLHLANKFPVFRERLRRFIEGRYYSGGSRTNLFSKKRKAAEAFELLGAELFNLKANRRAGKRAAGQAPRVKKQGNEFEQSRGPTESPDERQRRKARRREERRRSRDDENSRDQRRSRDDEGSRDRRKRRKSRDEENPRSEQMNSRDDDRRERRRSEDRDQEFDDGQGEPRRHRHHHHHHRPDTDRASEENRSEERSRRDDDRRGSRDEDRDFQDEGRRRRSENSERWPREDDRDGEREGKRRSRDEDDDEGHDRRRSRNEEEGRRGKRRSRDEDDDEGSERRRSRNDDEGRRGKRRSKDEDDDEGSERRRSRNDDEGRRGKRRSKDDSEGRERRRSSRDDDDGRGRRRSSRGDDEASERRRRRHEDRKRLRKSFGPDYRDYYN